MTHKINDSLMARRAFEAHYPTTHAACPIERDIRNLERYLFQVTQSAWELYLSAWEACIQSKASLQQSFEMHVVQADSMRELLDLRAPNTEGNIVSRCTQVLLAHSNCPCVNKSPANLASHG
jgi:hypothetical protein